MTASQVCMTLSPGRVAPSRARVTLSQRRMPPSQGRMPPSQARVTPSQARVTLSQARVTPSQARVSPSQARVTLSQGRMTPSQARVTPSQARVTSSQGRMTPSQTRVTSSQGRMSRSLGRSAAARARPVPASAPAPAHRDVDSEHPQSRRPTGGPMRRPTHTLVGIILGALAPGLPLSAQALPDSTQTWLVGRHETARVILEPLPIAADLARAADRSRPTDERIDHPVAHLVTDLPVHLGEGLLAPGSYVVRVRVEGTTPILDVQPSDGPGAVRSPGDSAVTAMQFPGARSARRGAEPVIRIETLRLDTDTLSFVDRSTPQMSITEIRMQPATTSELVVILGRWSWRVPIRAR